MHCAQMWRASTCLNGGLFGLPCHIKKVICDVSGEPTDFFFRLTLFEADGEKIDRKDFAVHTGRIHTSDWPKFPPVFYIVVLLLSFSSAPISSRVSQPKDGVSVFCRNVPKTLGYTV